MTPSLFILTDTRSAAFTIREALASRQAFRFSCEGLTVASLSVEGLQSLLTELDLLEGVRFFEGSLPEAILAALPRGTQMLVQAHQTRQVKEPSPSIPWDSPGRLPPGKLDP